MSDKPLFEHVGSLYGQLKFGEIPVAISSSGPADSLGNRYVYVATSTGNLYRINVSVRIRS